jgi:excisionase family DNA binding protein
MKQTISIELTDEQISKIVESRQLQKPESYSIRGAARQIGISESNIRKRIKEGFISTVKIGVSPRITQKEIERFVNA